MQSVSLEDSSHEMSNLILREKNRKTLINLSSAESANSVVNNNSKMPVHKKGYKIMLFLNKEFIYLTFFSDY